MTSRGPQRPTALGPPRRLPSSKLPRFDEIAMTDNRDNPLLRAWHTPYGLPPFDEIAPEHFAPAFDHAMQAHRAEITAITGNPEAPSFENTMVALDIAGGELRRVSKV